MLQLIINHALANAEGVRPSDIHIVEAAETLLGVVEGPEETKKQVKKRKEKETLSVIKKKGKMVKGGKPFSQITFPKGSIKHLKKKYKSSQHQCKELVRQLEEQRMELERCRTKFVEALEEKGMEISQL
eukprot:Gb_33252 [translate_table: standard]